MSALRQDFRGFTIVELVIGIALSAIFVGTIAVMQTNTAKISERGRDVSVLNSYAENKIEALRSKGYLSVSTGTQDVTNELPDELKSPRSASLSITDESAGMKKAVLTIAYNDQGEQKSYSYTTYIGEVGVGQY